MATRVTYQPQHVGDWGVPEAAAGGSYGTDTLAMTDGTRLFFRYWRAASERAPVLALLHGLGAHSGWFIDMGNALNARGLNVYVNDHRGFGRSEGPRGHVRRARVYLEDLATYLGEVRRRHPNAPLFVLGHSMGGIFAVYTASAGGSGAQTGLAGVILMNPWVRDASSVSPAVSLRIFGGGLVGSARPWAVAGGPEVMTTNSAAREMLDADTYWVRAESAAFLYQITLLRSAMLRRARQVRVPALVVQAGGDRAIVPAASRQCYEALGSADKTWKTYPSYSHDCEFEPDRSELDDDLADWILRHGS
jgi:alpha-beta hydrolase superfamily lysophospholipase